MKKVFIVVFLLLGVFCTSQSIVIKQDKKSSLARGIYFPFSLIGKNCESYIITTDNGKIERDNSGCKFSVKPENIGIAKITVKNKAGKIITEEIYAVREIEFKISFLGSENNHISSEKFSKMGNFILFSPDFLADYSWKCQFEIIHITEKERNVYSFISENGSLLSLRKKITSLNKGDILIFHKMKILIGEEQIDTSDIVLFIE